MQYKVLEDGPQRRFAVVFDKGDEMLEALSRFAREQRLEACEFTGMGAFSYAMLGQFDWDRDFYNPFPIEERVEVLSLVGRMRHRQSKPELDIHVAVAKYDGAICGGHLLEGYVKPQFELTLTEAQGAGHNRPTHSHAA